jgi:hypothetical protein
VTGLRDALTDYLQLRRRLGFQMPQDGRLLEGFVTFLERAGGQRITTDLALDWARLPGLVHPSYWRQRLSVVRGFARPLATLDPASEVPSLDLLPAHRPRLAPYIYTDDEIAALMAALLMLPPVGCPGPPPEPGVRLTAHRALHKSRMVGESAHTVLGQDVGMRVPR